LKNRYFIKNLRNEGKFIFDYVFHNVRNKGKIELLELYRWYKSCSNYDEKQIKPWFPTNFNEEIDKYIHYKDVIFEYGSGNSSLYFSNKVESVISIEHNNKWYAKLKKTIYKLNISNLSIVLIKPEKIDKLLSQTNKIFHSNDYRYQNYTFEHYVKSINKYPDENFDIIIIDGRARVGCVKYSMPKLKKGGYLLLDDSNRIFYSEINDLLYNWSSKTYRDYKFGVKSLTQLTIWKKPY